jgi:hypothetical protein
MLKVGGLYRYIYYGQKIKFFENGELVLCTSIVYDLPTFLTKNGLKSLKWTWAHWWFDEMAL